MTSTRFAVVAVLLALAPDVMQGEDPPAPTRLVPNPVAETWAAFPAGAWVRMTTRRLDAPDSARSEQLQVLIDVRPEAVGVWTGNPTESGLLGWIEELDRNVGPDELGATWTGKGPRLGQATESKERIRLLGKDFGCRVFDLPLNGVDAEFRRVRVWVHPDVPGGIVRSEAEERDHAKGWVPMRSEVTGYGRLPDGSFAFPPNVIQGMRLVDNPSFLGWSRFPVGAWVERRKESVGFGGRSGQRERLRLVETRPNRLFAEVERLQASDGAEVAPTDPKGPLESEAGASEGKRPVRAGREEIPRRIHAHVVGEDLRGTREWMPRRRRRRSASVARTSRARW